ncbi:hypothetical protein BD289DRAFT_121276 [Coniella lustricola]|uniref:Uncharacterized protein n=1 Tax=Coniella lustricola TaxID=2025994 RepID=A0A2T2ZWS9_9PEZI|nr:hypothetical protein BD289DRAFT_121276 [Coniella lustricola]
MRPPLLHTHIFTHTHTHTHTHTQHTKRRARFSFFCREIKVLLERRGKRKRQGREVRLWNSPQRIYSGLDLIGTEQLVGTARARRTVDDSHSAQRSQEDPERNSKRANGNSSRQASKTARQRASTRASERATWRLSDSATNQPTDRPTEG